MATSFPSMSRAADGMTPRPLIPRTVMRLK